MQRNFTLYCGVKEKLTLDNYNSKQMLFKLDNINLKINDKEIFRNINFIFHKNDRIGIIGDNGVGKTTLLKIITGKIECSGQIITNSDNYGYLKQDESINITSNVIRIKEIEELIVKDEVIADTKLYDELLEEYNLLLAGDSLDVENDLLKKFNFDYELFLRENKDGLSGGEMTKLKLISMLSHKYDYLLLDEPTNHLDIDSKNVLIEELDDKNSFIIISHDVKLLNKCCNKIIEVKNQTLKEYVGNYDNYLKEEKKEKDDIIRKQMDDKRRIDIINNGINNRQQREKSKKDKIKNLEQKNIKNRAADNEELGFHKGSLDVLMKKNSIIKKRKLIEIDNLDTPELDKEEFIKINYKDFVKPNAEVVKIENLNCKIDQFSLNVKNLNIENTDKLLLKGNNGSGKSTLLKLIIGDIKNFNGVLKIGNNVKIGYVDQKQEQLNLSNTILQELVINNEYIDETEIRTYLGKFLFKKNDVFKKIEDLSGGEKMRLSLLKLVLKGANFLILDEPSNHLDIKSKNVLGKFLEEFPGTILIVSHDTEFVKKFVNKKVEIINGIVK